MHNDRIDNYEDAWLDWLPYKISGYLALGVSGLSIDSLIFGCLWMSLTDTWGSNTNGWYAAAFVLGILFTIVCGIGWIFFLPTWFDEYKKWRKAKRRYDSSKSTVE